MNSMHFAESIPDVVAPLMNPTRFHRFAWPEPYWQSRKGALRLVSDSVPNRTML
jgi:hypothetical protein